MRTELDVTRRHGPAVQYALLAGPLLSMVDSSIVNVALAPIARELNASLPVVQWAVSGYLLALGAGLAATAYLARRFGTLPAYRASSRSAPSRRHWRRHASEAPGSTCPAWCCWPPG